MMPIGITKSSVSIVSPGRNGAARSMRRRKLGRGAASPATSAALAVSAVMTIVSRQGDELGAEDLVEGVDDGLRRGAGALEVHGLDGLRLVVKEPVGAFLLALVHEDLVGLLVEQRPAVEDEVRGNVFGLLGKLEEGHDQVLVGAALHDHLGVHPTDGPLLGREDVEVRAALVL